MHRAKTRLAGIALCVGLAVAAFAQSTDQVSLSVSGGVEQEEGLRWVQREGDGAAYITEDSGREGLMTDPDNGQHQIYADVDDEFLRDGQPTREVWVSVEYLDYGTDTFMLEYDAGPGFPDEQFKDAFLVTKTDSGAFRTVIYHLTDVSFNNRQQGTADLRVDDRGDGAEFVTRIVVSKTPLTLPDAGSVTGRVVEANAQAAGVPNVRLVANNGFSTMTDADGNFTLPLQEGSYQIQVLRPGYLKVEPQDVSVSAGQATQLNISLEPFGKDTVTLSAADGAPVEDGLRWVFVEGSTDGFGQVETVDGSEAIRTGPDTEPYPDMFLYGDVDDNYLFDGMPTQEVYITIEYLDQGTAPFSLEYDSMEGPWTGSVRSQRTNTGEWKTFTWHLTNARFANREQNVADFRIGDGGGGDDNDLFIRKVTVSTQPPAEFGLLTGTVVKEGTNQPVAGALVKAGTGQTTNAGDDGTFSLQLPAGSHTLTISATGVETTTFTDIQVVAGQTTAAPPFVLKPAAVRTSVSLTAANGQPVSDGLAWVERGENTDGYGTIETFEGREVLRTGPSMEAHTDRYLYVDVDDTFLFDGRPTTEVWITMEYYDAGTAVFSLDYDAQSNMWKAAEGGNRTDTGEWKTFTWHLTDVRFANREQNVADFRIFDSDTGDDNDLFISRITVSTVDPNAPAVTKGDVDGNGQVAILDVVTALRIVAGLAEATPANLAGGDLNANGRIEITEVVQILRAVAGLAPL